MTDDSKCICGHVRESHDQTATIQGVEHQNVCRSCTCPKYLQKSFMDAVTHSENTKSGKQDEEDERKKFYIQKYTNGALAEAILLNDLPMFLQIVDGQIVVKERIEKPDAILFPIERPGYLNMPYAFASQDEIKQYVERARTETFDSLFSKVKAIWSKYIDGDKDHITICAADTIFTYFQDKLGITHYLLFVGDNGTGKGSNLRVFKELAYRPLFDTSITPANIYQYLGSIEEGQGIILEDEADNIDESNEKMRIYKVGYTAGAKVSRIDTSFGRKQIGFWTYCFKAFAAERSPDSVRGKGFNERTFVIQCSIGYPKYDMTEVTNPAGEQKYQALLDELVDIRKLLLIYRLLRFNQPIPDIELNISNREKQLCKPLIRLLQDSQAVKEIMATLSNLLSQKRERKGNTLEARLYQVINQAISENQSQVLPNAELWQRFKEMTPGTDIPNKPQSYDTEEFGLVSQKVLTGILKDKFCATQKRDTERKIILCQDKLERLKNVYGLPEQIEIVRGLESTHQTLSTLFQGVYPEKEDDSTIGNEQGNTPDELKNKPENQGKDSLEVSNPSEVSKMEVGN